MNKIVNFSAETVDFDVAVDEVDLLIPRYLEAIERLDMAQEDQEIEAAVQNVDVYWNRLRTLFQELEQVEQQLPFDEIIRDTMQAELSTLERAYMRLNVRIEFSEASWTKRLWIAARAVLKRMDTVLRELGFPEHHEDRLLITDIQNRNRERYQTWLLRYKLNS